ncbi:MAG: methionyl-tRNA formyltransferase [Pseudomonadota bacterium]
MTRQRLAFMGSPEFSIPVLDALINAGHEIACVYCQPPRRAGRGKSVRKTPVHAHAEALGLDVRTPQRLKGEEERADFAALDLDAAVVVAYGLILPQSILTAPRLGCMNLHASSLPRWRGAAPIQRAIMAGDQETGVDAMVMEAGLDTGPVIAGDVARIFPSDTAGDLHDRLSHLAANLAPRALEGWASGMLVPEPQAGHGITYADKITAADQPIRWREPAHVIDCQIRGLSPGPGATFQWASPGTGQDGEGDALSMKALGSRLEADCGPLANQVSVTPGTCLDDRLLVATGEGAVRITRVQRPGKAPMDAEVFLNGTSIPAGTVFS